ncbi:MAG TPA: ribosome biogenesis GTPase Der [Candidatus Babeliales bacterium]|nr:ribosome biogenesis GTPase Der [Candidatus Babeliales bacterium]
MNSLPKVVIVGRTNVGKSSLFNRISKTIKSIALDETGVTRDYLKDAVTYKGTSFDLVDTGGLVSGPEEDSIAVAIREQALDLIKRSQVVVFVVDGTVGILPDEQELARMLHKLGVPVILAVNKIDVKITQENLYEFDRLGFKDIIPVSATHGTGVNELLVKATGILKENSHDVAEIQKPEYKVVLLGKPNVGKSSLMNILTTEQRSLVADFAGTTRESISEPVKFEQSTLEITDTAGVRRKKTVKSDIENLMVKSSLASVRTSDIILLMVDSHEGHMSDQELKLAFYVFEQGKALILLFNKSDIVDEYEKGRLDYELEKYQFFMKRLESLTISCKTKKNLHKLLPLVKTIWERYNLKIATDELTELFKRMLMRKPLFKQEKRLEVHKAEQVGTAPMSLKLTVNYPQFFGEREFSFFENILRKNYDLKSVPVLIDVAKPKKKKR